MDVFADPADDDDDGLRGVSTFDDVFLVVGVDDASVAPVVFVSVLGSAFKAVFALATIPELFDLTCATKNKQNLASNVYRHSLVLNGRLEIRSGAGYSGPKLCQIVKEFQKCMNYI